MNTLIEITSTNYKFENSNEVLRMEGNFVYSTLIESLNCSVYSSNEGNYIGNIYYQEFGDGNTNLNYTVPMEYLIESFNLITTIINDIKQQIKTE